MRVILSAACIASAAALNNGVGRLPLMGWSTWYWDTSNINASVITSMADAMVSSGLNEFGWRFINLDDGWAFSRNATTGEILADPVEFPDGMGAVAAYINNKGLQFGIYTCRGNLTCLKRPGSYGYESVDAATYASWNVSFVKEDSCYGMRSADVDYGIMRDALNQTGHPFIFNVCNPGFGNGTYGHSWRTGPDLYAQDWDMTVNRWQLAATPAQRAATGCGAFPDPDNLEVGYSPRAQPGAGATPLEQRSMFSMWVMLPAPLVLAADLRTGLDAYTMETLTNKAMIAVNQDELCAPGVPIVGDTDTTVSVWAKPLSNGDVAVMLVNLLAPGNATIGFSFADLPLVPPFNASGNNGNTTVTVTNLWTAEMDTVYGTGYSLSVQPHEAAVLRVSTTAA